MKNQLCKLNMFCICSDSFSVNSTWQSTPLYPNLVYIHCFLTSGNSVFQDYRQILDVFTTSTGSYEVTKQKVVGYLLSNILSLWYLTTRGIKNFGSWWFQSFAINCFQLHQNLCPTKSQLRQVHLKNISRKLPNGRIAVGFNFHVVSCFVSLFSKQIQHPAESGFMICKFQSPFDSIDTFLDFAKILTSRSEETF